MDVLLFNRWSFSGVEVRDPGLKKYINLHPVVLPKTCGKYGTVSIHKSKMNVVERFINKLYELCVHLKLNNLKSPLRHLFTSSAKDFQ